jgi:phage terminase large subunit
METLSVSSTSSDESSTLEILTPRAFKPLLSPARYLGAWGGRGSGKSHFFAELAIEASVARKTDIVCVREVQKSLRQSVKKLLELKIEALGVGAYFDVLDAEIRSVHGGLIIFEGMQSHTADSIKSLEGYDVAWAEESQSLSQRSLDMLRPTIRKEGSQLWFSWNPDLPTDPVDVLLRGPVPPPDAVVVRVNHEDNPWFPDVLRQEMEYDRARDPDKYAHIWRGEYLQHSEARVFRNWKVEEFERPVGTIFRLGADWGYAIDPSVLVRCSLDGNRLYVDHEAYMVGCEIVQLPDLFDRVPECRNWFITADSARPETISHLQRNGFPKINPALKGARSVEEGVAFLQSFDIIVHPRCQHVIDELTLYSYKQDPLTEKVLPILGDKNNHCIDALRYACEGARKTMNVKKLIPLRYDNRGYV